MKFIDNTSRRSRVPIRRPRPLVPYLFFLLFALIAGATYFGGLPPAAPSAPSASNPTAASTATPRYVTKEIRDIQPGDLVLARDENGTEIQRKPVAQVFRRTSDHLRILTFRSPDDRRQVLKTTNKHPFWVVNRQQFINAGDLEPGDTVTGPNGELQHLLTTRYEPHPDGIPVFNFEVTDYHTYYVAENGARAPPLLVHNADGYDRPRLSNEALNDAYNFHRKGDWDDAFLNSHIHPEDVKIIKDKLANYKEKAAKKAGDLRHDTNKIVEIANKSEDAPKNVLSGINSTEIGDDVMDALDEAVEQEGGLKRAQDEFRNRDLEDFTDSPEYDQPDV